MAIGCDVFGCVFCDKVPVFSSVCLLMYRCLFVCVCVLFLGCVTSVFCPSYLMISLPVCRPDMTFVVDWVLKMKYIFLPACLPACLSISPSLSLSLITSTRPPTYLHPSVYLYLSIYLYISMYNIISTKIIAHSISGSQKVFNKSSFHLPKDQTPPPPPPPQPPHPTPMISSFPSHDTDVFGQEGWQVEAQWEINVGWWSGPEKQRQQLGLIKFSCLCCVHN